MASTIHNATLAQLLKQVAEISNIVQFADLLSTCELQLDQKVSECEVVFLAVLEKLEDLNDQIRTSLETASGGNVDDNNSAMSISHWLARQAVRQLQYIVFDSSRRLAEEEASQLSTLFGRVVEVLVHGFMLPLMTTFKETDQQARRSEHVDSKLVVRRVTRMEDHISSIFRYLAGDMLYRHVTSSPWFDSHAIILINTILEADEVFLRASDPLPRVYSMPAVRSVARWLEHPNIVHSLLTDPKLNLLPRYFRLLATRQRSHEFRALGFLIRNSTPRAVIRDFVVANNYNFMRFLWNSLYLIPMNASAHIDDSPCPLVVISLLLGVDVEDAERDREKCFYVPPSFFENRIGEFSTYIIKKKQRDEKFVFDGDDVTHRTWERTTSTCSRYPLELLLSRVNSHPQSTIVKLIDKIVEICSSKPKDSKSIIFGNSIRTNLLMCALRFTHRCEIFEHVVTKYGDQFDYTNYDDTSMTVAISPLINLALELLNCKSCFKLLFATVDTKENVFYIDRTLLRRRLDGVQRSSEKLEFFVFLLHDIASTISRERRLFSKKDLRELLRELERNVNEDVKIATEGGDNLITLLFDGPVEVLEQRGAKCRDCINEMIQLYFPGADDDDDDDELGNDEYTRRQRPE